MIRQMFIFLIVFLLFQCSPKDSTREKQNLLDAAKVETLEAAKADTTKRNQSYLTCKCDWEVKRFNHYTDLSFSNNSITHPFNPDSLSKWKDNPERLKIRSLELVDFDTIPVDFKIFENVDRVYLLGYGKNVQGLDIFPALRVLQAEGVYFQFDRNSKWLEDIEVIEVNKSEFLGIKSFKQLPNLREIRLSFSGFDSFPSDFESLKCLTYFQTGAHTTGEIDLTKLDLSSMKCLSYVEFHSWRENIKGVPKGIDHIETVNISHPNLTKVEKSGLKKVRGRK